jgi:methenyltetrahydromethanopterin cyclohydrolase
LYHLLWRNILHRIEYGDAEKLAEFVKKAPSTTSETSVNHSMSHSRKQVLTFSRSMQDVRSAKITINDKKTKKSFTSGRINPGILLDSFGIKEV